MMIEMEKDSRGSGSHHLLILPIVISPRRVGRGLKPGG